MHPFTRLRTLTSRVRRGDGAVSDPPATSTRPPVITSGDVLVSRPTARADVYDVGVVAAAAHTSEARYEDAIESGRRLARALKVDGWFTCDHTHYLRIATHRK